MAIAKPKGEEAIVGYGYKIKAKATLNADDFYKEIYRWFEHHGYEWKELQYKKIEFPGGNYRLELLWQGIKPMDDYTTFVIDLHLAADLSNVEVTAETGQKGKRQKGTYEFRSGANIIKNVDVWKGKPFGQIQAKLYDVLIRKRIDQQKTDAYLEVHKLYDELKAFMMLYKTPG
ncbi:hypothetical protein HOC80_01010 [archaeon]|nr:hypothetical protein [archaeon]